MSEKTNENKVIEGEVVKETSEKKVGFFSKLKKHLPSVDDAIFDGCMVAITVGSLVRYKKFGNYIDLVTKEHISDNLSDVTKDVVDSVKE